MQEVSILNDPFLCDHRRERAPRRTRTSQRDQLLQIGAPMPAFTCTPSPPAIGTVQTSSPSARSHHSLSIDNWRHRNLQVTHPPRASRQQKNQQLYGRDRTTQHASRPKAQRVQQELSEHVERRRNDDVREDEYRRGSDGMCDHCKSDVSATFALSRERRNDTDRNPSRR